jgi:hypothetical protein
MATLGYLVKKTSAEVEASPWGMPFRMADADAFPYDMLIERMGESGVKWMRVDSPWSGVERSAGHYTWDLVDKVVEGLTARHQRLPAHR